MMALIERHPEFPLKFNGAQHFEVDSDGRGGRGFFAVDHIRRRINFGIPACVSGRAPTPDQVARDAARTAVADQTFAFRDSTLWTEAGAVCGLCGEAITAQSCHVDHQAPQTFVALWQAFRERFPDLDISTHTAPGKQCGIRLFSDPTTEAEWAGFHRAHAVLRLLHAACNMGAARRRSP